MKDDRKAIGKYGTLPANFLLKIDRRKDGSRHKMACQLKSFLLFLITVQFL
jgi:hypothetical protein